MRSWKLTIWIGMALLALAGLQLAIWGAGEDGIRVLVRSSARSSLLLFALAFSASSLRTFWRSDLSGQVLAQRRQLGVAYAVSHGLHAAALIALYQVSESFANDLGAVTVVGGGLAYVFTIAMAATSTDAAVAAFGRRRWRMLHTIGGWYIWIIFAQSYLPRAATAPEYLPAGLVVLAVPALRIARWSRARSRARANAISAGSGAGS